MKTKKMWMARGDSGRLYEEFRESGIAAIGWADMVDARVGMSRQELAAHFATVRPDLKRGTVISGASQVWRFANEVAIDDYVVTYNPSTRKYLVGEYVNRPSADDPGLTMSRKTKWLGEVDRDDLSTKTKNSLGSTLCGDRSISEGGARFGKRCASI